MIDPKVKEIVDQSRQKLEKLQEEKDEEILEFQEQHAENRFKAAKKIKDRYKVKITMAKKKNDTEEITKLEGQQKEELKKLDEKLQEESVAGKNNIKERYNELSSQVQIDVKGFIEALLKKKDVSMTMEKCKFR